MTASQNSAHEPIAATYGELQSLPDIQAFFDSIPPALDDDERMMAVLVGCLDICFLGASDLCERGCSSVPVPDETSSFGNMAHRQAWHAEIMRICLTLADRLQGFALSRGLSLEDAKPFVSEAHSEYIRNKEALAKLLVTLFKTKSAQSLLKTAVAVGKSTNQLAHLQLCLKRAHYWYCCARTRLALPAEMTKTEGMLGDSRRLHLAVAKPKIARDTFFTQFRILHQVPELLALEGLRLNAAAIRQIDSLEKPLNSSVHAVCLALRRIADVCRDMLACVEPIAGLMFPSDYEKIRRNLGKTSGSQSESIAKLLFRKEVVELGRSLELLAFKTTLRNRPKLVSLWQEYHQIVSIVILWREMHFQFPRHVLGGGGTASLIGAPDAIVSARDMAASYLKTQNLVQMQGASRARSSFLEEDSTPVPEAESAALDRILMEATGEVVRGWFADVQNRARKNRDE